MGELSDVTYHFHILESTVVFLAQKRLPIPKGFSVMVYAVILTVVNCLNHPQP